MNTTFTTGTASMKTTYNTILAPSESLFRDRGSRFLGFSYPISSVEEVRGIIRRLKDAHPKAVHFCYAYRIGTDDNNFRANDDGEPSGSAGKPVLGQIDSASLTNMLIVVIRYFGGTLLGVPGLIHAYKTAAAEAIAAATIIEKQIEKNITLEFGYELMNEVMMLLRQSKAHIIRQDLQLFCTLEAGIPLTEYDTCVSRLGQLYQLTIRQ